MTKFVDIDSKIRGQILRKKIAVVPEYLKEPIRSSRRSPTLDNWKRVRHLNPQNRGGGPNVWSQVENSIGRRITHLDKPTKAEFDLWLWLYAPELKYGPAIEEHDASI